MGAVVVSQQSYVESEFTPNSTNVLIEQNAKYIVKCPRCPNKDCIFQTTIERIIKKGILVQNKEGIIIFELSDCGSDYCCVYCPDGHYVALYLDDDPKNY